MKGPYVKTTENRIKAACEYYPPPTIEYSRKVVVSSIQEVKDKRKSVCLKIKAVSIPDGLHWPNFLFARQNISTYSIGSRFLSLPISKRRSIQATMQLFCPVSHRRGCQGNSFHSANLCKRTAETEYRFECGWMWPVDDMKKHESMNRWTSSCWVQLDQEFRVHEFPPGDGWIQWLIWLKVAVSRFLTVWNEGHWWASGEAFSRFGARDTHPQSRGDTWRSSVYSREKR